MEFGSLMFCFEEQCLSMWITATNGKGFVAYILYNSINLYDPSTS